MAQPQERQGPITENELIKSLVGAKKIMNVGDNFQKQGLSIPTDNGVPSIPTQPRTPVLEDFQNMKQKPEVDIDRVNKTKLPDSIKKAMIESPIPKVSLNDGVKLDFSEKTKKLMQEENVNFKQPKHPSQQPRSSYGNNLSSNDISSILAPLVENAVRKVMDEKLNQVLLAENTTSVNENFSITIGNSIFKGKITKHQKKS
jgi:hypothetical protein